MKITLLGTGTSQGVPVIACDCEVCQSTNPKDKRLRSSVLIETKNKVIVVDTGPDFRQQMLRENVKQLNAIVFTHGHKDHVAGLDDVRAFNYKQKEDMELYAEPRVQETLKREFHYAFHEHKYPGVPELHLNDIENKPFTIEDVNITPIRGFHYKLPVLGFRVGDFTYITDTNRMEKEEIKKIEGSKILVINALRKEEHISHFNLEQALAIIEKTNVEKAYLTHISHYMGLHDIINKELPKNVELAYDGLSFEL